MKEIYVYGNYRLQEGDEILDTFESYSKLRVKSEEPYTGFVVDIDEKFVYETKLAICHSLRVLAYSRLNQDELRYNDLVNGTKTWIEAIEEIKQQYPKPEVPEEFKEEILGTPIVPTSITRKQAKIILLKMNLLESVEEAINEGSTEQVIEWSDSLVFERDNPLLVNIANKLGLTEEQIDQMFIEAHKL